MSSIESLPIINLAPFLNSDPSDSNRIAATAALHSACVNFGFFYLDIRAFIDPREPEELARLASRFFALPQEEKDKLSLKNQDYARGMYLSLHLSN
jgi:isopenicillin N synthase-like dioxygenase